MDYNDPTFVAGRLVWKFKDCGDSGEFAMPFADLPANLQTYLRIEAAIESDEKPALACFFEEESWTVLTTKRLVWRDFDSVRNLRPEEIERMNMDLERLRELGWKKEALDRLDVVTGRGQIHKVRFESGRPFFGFWNALLLLVRRAAVS